MAKAIEAIKSALATTLTVIVAIIAALAVFDLLTNRSLSNIGSGIVRVVIAIGTIANGLATFVEKGGLPALLILIGAGIYIVRRLRKK